MARRRRKRGRGAIGFVLAGVACWAVVRWIASLKPADRRTIALSAALVAAIAACAAWQSWRRRRRARREYRQMLRDFRWREDMSPREFEKCCADYLTLQGWRARTTGRSGDQGADVLAEKNGLRLVIQCKKYRRPIGNRAVQEVHAARAYVGAQAAAVVSNQGYTRAAQDLATKTGVMLLHFTELRNLDDRLGEAARDPFR
ncbi:MAG TPA: restriction endonuclease [Stellaceae bacterium]|nr:restriction endonuclease [Stellaceae bacterium]